MPRCIRDNDPGGRDNPLDRCTPLPGAAGQCVILAFPDPRYCRGMRYESRYDPTEEETAGYPDREWLENVGDVLFETVFGVFNTAISAATDGIVEEWLGDEVTLETLLSSAISNMGEKAIQLVSDVGSKITELVSGVVNESATAMGEFLGVANAQKRIADEVVSTVEYLLEHGEWEADVLREEAIVAAQAALDKANEQLRYDEYLATEAAALFSQSAIDFVELEATNLFERADTLRGFTFDGQRVQQDIMYSLALEHGITVADSFSAIADRKLETVNEIFIEGILKPLAQSEAQYHAIKAASIVTRSEFEGSMLEQAILTAELAADLMGTEVNPLDYLRQRLKDL